MFENFKIENIRLDIINLILILIIGIIVIMNSYKLYSNFNNNNNNNNNNNLKNRKENFTNFEVPKVDWNIGNKKFLLSDDDGNMETDVSIRSYIDAYITKIYENLNKLGSDLYYEIDQNYANTVKLDKTLLLSLPQPWNKNSREDGKIKQWSYMTSDTDLNEPTKNEIGVQMESGGDNANMMGGHWKPDGTIHDFIGFRIQQKEVPGNDWADVGTSF